MTGEVLQCCPARDKHSARCPVTFCYPQPAPRSGLTAASPSADIHAILSKFAGSCKEPHEVRSNQDLMEQHFGAQLAQQAHGRNAGKKDGDDDGDDDGESQALLRARHFPFPVEPPMACSGHAPSRQCWWRVRVSATAVGLPAVSRWIAAPLAPSVRYLTQTTTTTTWLMSLRPSVRPRGMTRK